MRRLDSDRGVAALSYALVVTFIAMASFSAVSALGKATADSFQQYSEATSQVSESTLTPLQKWEQAKEAYKTAIANAKAKKKADLAAARASYKAALNANKSLPKAERKPANKAAKATYKAAKTQINADYKATVNAAKAVRNAAKAEYKASK